MGHVEAPMRALRVCAFVMGLAVLGGIGVLGSDVSAAPTAIIPAPGVTLPPGPTSPAATTTTMPAAAAGTTTLVDQLGRIMVTVPSTWTDVDLQASTFDDGSPRSRITASPDIASFVSDWDTPGLYVTVIPAAAAEPRALLDYFSFTGSCTDGGTATYDDGRFIGLMQTWTNCAGGESKLIHIAARPTAGAAFTAVVQILWTGPADDQALQTILGSFTSVPGAGPATQLGPVAPLTDAAPIDPTLLNTEVPDARNITDTSGRISLSVPAPWTDTSSYRVIGNTGAERRVLDVAPDVAAFYDRWSVPGLSVVIYPTRPDPQTLLVNEGWIWKDNCIPGDIVAVDTRG